MCVALQMQLGKLFEIAFHIKCIVMLTEVKSCIWLLLLKECIFKLRSSWSPRLQFISLRSSYNQWPLLYKNHLFIVMSTLLHPVVMVTCIQLALYCTTNWSSEAFQNFNFKGNLNWATQGGPCILHPCMTRHVPIVLTAACIVKLCDLRFILSVCRLAIYALSYVHLFHFYEASAAISYSHGSVIIRY